MSINKIKILFYYLVWLSIVLKLNKKIMINNQFKVDLLLLLELVRKSLMKLHRKWKEMCLWLIYVRKELLD